MIQKYQTLINRFANYLEDNQELVFIKKYLNRKQKQNQEVESLREDQELKAHLIEMNSIIQRIRKSLEILSNNVHKLELSSNAAFSHLKRKARVLGVSNYELGTVIEDELRITNPKEILAVANRLSKLLDFSKKRQNKTPAQIEIEEDATTLVQMIVGVYQDMNTIEGEVIQIMKREHVARPHRKAVKEIQNQQSANG